MEDEDEDEANEEEVESAPRGLPEGCLLDEESFAEFRSSASESSLPIDWNGNSEVETVEYRAVFTY